MAVIPLGGSNITKDICSQQIEEEEAEELKKKYGNAYADKSEDGDDNPTYSLDGKCSIESHLLEAVSYTHLDVYKRQYKEGEKL